MSQFMLIRASPKARTSPQSGRLRPRTRGRTSTSSTTAEVSRRSQTIAVGGISVNRCLATAAPSCTDTIPPSTSQTADPRPGAGWEPAVWTGCCWLVRKCSALARVDGLGRGGQDLVQVAHDAEVDELEERRLLVLVDRDDRLRGLHAGPVLDGTGDARGDVELRGDRLAGLADLEGVRHPARVDGGAGGADRRTERVGEALDRGEVATGATATGDHDRGLGELGAPGRLARLGLDHLRGLRS